MIEFFSNDHSISRLVNGLPKAFEMATMEIPPGNPAIGLIREHIITGFFINEFGKNRVNPTADGVKRGYDIFVCGCPLSIKTVLKNAGVKVLWTVDPLKMGLEMARDYTPTCNIFLVKIYWEREQESIFYIPTVVQSEVRNDMKDRYLTAKVGTNHRGIAISTEAMKRLKNDNRVLRRSVNWQKSGLDYTPYERWDEFWGQCSQIINP